VFSVILGACIYTPTFLCTSLWFGQLYIWEPQHYFDWRLKCCYVCFKDTIRLRLCDMSLKQLIYIIRCFL